MTSQLAFVLCADGINDDPLYVELQIGNSAWGELVAAPDGGVAIHLSLPSCEEGFKVDLDEFLKFLERARMRLEG